MDDKIKNCIKELEDRAIENYSKSIRADNYYTGKYAAIRAKTFNDSTRILKEAFGLYEGPECSTSSKSAAEKLVDEFITACCVSVPTMGPEFSDFYKAYVTWHEGYHADKQVLNKRKLFVVLKRRYGTEKVAGHTYINDLFLRNERHQPQPSK